MQSPGPAFVSQPPSSMQQRLTQQQQQPGHQQQQTAGYYDVSTSDSESGSDSGPLRVPLKLVVQDAVKRWFNETLSEVCEQQLFTCRTAAAVLGQLFICRRAPDTNNSSAWKQRAGGGECAPHTDSAAPAFVCACVVCWLPLSAGTTWRHQAAGVLTRSLQPSTTSIARQGAETRLCVTDSAQPSAPHSYTASQ